MKGSPWSTAWGWTVLLLQIGWKTPSLDPEVMQSGLGLTSYFGPVNFKKVEGKVSQQNVPAKFSALFLQAFSPPPPPRKKITPKIHTQLRGAAAFMTVLVVLTVLAVVRNTLPSFLVLPFLVSWKKARKPTEKARTLNPYQTPQKRGLNPSDPIFVWPHVAGTKDTMWTRMSAPSDLCIRRGGRVPIPSNYWDAYWRAMDQAMRSWSGGERLWITNTRIRRRRREKITRRRRWRIIWKWRRIWRRRRRRRRRRRWWWWWWWWLGSCGPRTEYKTN